MVGSAGSADPARGRHRRQGARPPSGPARCPEDEAHQDSVRRSAETLQAAEKRGCRWHCPPSARRAGGSGSGPPASGTRGPTAKAEQVCDLPARRGPFGQSHSWPGARDGRDGAGLTAPEGGFQEKGVPLRTPAQSRVATEEAEVGVSPLGVCPAGALAQAAPRGGDLASNLR